MFLVMFLYMKGFIGLRVSDSQVTGLNLGEICTGYILQSSTCWSVIYFSVQCSYLAGNRKYATVV